MSSEVPRMHYKSSFYIQKQIHLGTVRLCCLGACLAKRFKDKLGTCDKNSQHPVNSCYQAICLVCTSKNRGQVFR